MADESPRFPRCCSARCLAWALGGTNPKTVIRAGFGFFYQRFDLINLLIATRYDGIAQQQYMVNNPDFFPMIPDIPSLTGSQQTIEKVNPRLRAPHLLNLGDRTRIEGSAVARFYRADASGSSAFSV